MTDMNFMDKPMSDEERIVMQETMYKQDIERLQSALTTAQEENKRYKDALINLKSRIGADDVIVSALNGGK